jgi:hypothetical protein
MKNSQQLLIDKKDQVHQNNNKKKYTFMNPNKNISQKTDYFFVDIPFNLQSTFYYFFNYQILLI